MMIVHRIPRNFKFRIPLEADRVVSARLGGADVSAKYDMPSQCFWLDHDDTDIACCDLEIEFEKDGKKEKETHRIEVI